MELLEAQGEGWRRLSIPRSVCSTSKPEGARDAPLNNGLVYWERPLVNGEEQIETLRHFLEQQPVLRPESRKRREGASSRGPASDLSSIYCRAEPIVSAIFAPRLPSGFGGPAVLSRAV